MNNEILGTEVDKTGRNLTILRSKNLAHSPAYSFFVRQMADLIDQGHSFAATTWRDKECGIIWAEDQGVICAIFCYHTGLLDSHGILSIQLTAVDQAYRKQGIHQILNRYYRQTAKEMGAAVVRATVHPNNLVRLATCEKDGLKLQDYLMYKRL